MTHLGSLGHGEELEAVERVCVRVQVRGHHLGRLLLHLARIVEDRGLLAFEVPGDGLAALRCLGGLFRHLLQRRDEARVLLPGELRDLPAGGFGRHRETGHLSQLLLEMRQFGHLDVPPVCEVGLG